jgi:carbon-monoxide dehydrogenase large subunit
VVAVLTAADYRADGNRPMAHAPASTSPPDIRLDNTDGSAIEVPHQSPLADGRVRFVGEPIVLVVAETPSQAKDAAELIDVDYQPLPSVTRAPEAVDPQAPLLWDNRASNVVVDALVGDSQATEADFARAAHIARLDTHVQRVTGVPMEPRAVLAEYDSATHRYSI